MQKRVNRSDICNIVNTISKRYYFQNNRGVWNEICKILMEKENIEISELDRILGWMGDVHLRILDMNKPSKMRICPLEQEGGELFYIEGDFRYKVLRIGEFALETILAEYSKDYKMFPKAVVISQAIQDFQFSRSIFKECKDIETTNGIMPIETISMDECQKMMRNNVCIKPIMIMEIDEKTLLVKILSFNCLGITSIFQQEIQKFNLENYHHIIFDIRDNPGGSVVEASNMIEFIAPKTIEYPYIIRDTELNEEKRIIFGTNKLGIDKDNIRIYVFVNENTASTAEYIFLEGIIQSFQGKVKVIGRRTQGTSGQAAVYRVSENVFLNVTIKRYYNAGGEELKFGFKPDIELETPVNQQYSDRFMQKYREVCMC